VHPPAAWEHDAAGRQRDSSERARFVGFYRVEQFGGKA
jgi:hypothetical protein